MSDKYLANRNNHVKIARYIDHTKLAATTSKEDIIQICNQAKEFAFASVCINPWHVSLAVQHLAQGSITQGSDTQPLVKVCTVVGFPLGATATKVKAYETGLAVEAGAQEIDMVINIGALKDGDYAFVENDIREVVKAATDKAIVKVIIEACYLSDDEKVAACKLAMTAGAHYVKTSTGFGTHGATKEDVALMRKTVGETIGVKASGGIKDLRTALAMIEAGATRIGTSSGIAIVTEQSAY